MKKVVWKTRFKGENCLFQSWKVELPVFQDISTIRPGEMSSRMRKIMRKKQLSHRHTRNFYEQIIKL